MDAQEIHGKPAAKTHKARLQIFYTRIHKYRQVYSHPSLFYCIFLHIPHRQSNQDHWLTASFDGCYYIRSTKWIIDPAPQIQPSFDPLVHNNFGREMCMRINCPKSGFLSPPRCYMSSAKWNRVPTRITTYHLWPHPKYHLLLQNHFSRELTFVLFRQVMTVDLFHRMVLMVPSGSAVFW